MEFSGFWKESTKSTPSCGIGEMSWCRFMNWEACPMFVVPLPRGEGYANLVWQASQAAVGLLLFFWRKVPLCRRKEDGFSSKHWKDFSHWAAWRVIQQLHFLCKMAFFGLWKWCYSSTMFYSNTRNNSTPPKTNITMEWKKQQFLIGDTSSNGFSSICHEFFGGVHSHPHPFVDLFPELWAPSLDLGRTLRWSIWVSTSLPNCWCGHLSEFWMVNGLKIYPISKWYNSMLVFFFDYMFFPYHCFCWNCVKALQIRPRHFFVKLLTFSPRGLDISLVTLRVWWYPLRSHQLVLLRGEIKSNLLSKAWGVVGCRLNASLP